MCDNGGYNILYSTGNDWSMYIGDQYTRAVQNNIILFLRIIILYIGIQAIVNMHLRRRRWERESEELWWKHRSRNRGSRRRRRQDGIYIYTQVYIYTHTTIQINTHIRRWRLRRRGREEDCGVRAHTGPGDRRRSMGPWRAPTGTVATPTAVQPGEPGEPGDRRQGSNRSRRDQRNKL